MSRAWSAVAAVVGIAGAAVAVVAAPTAGARWNELAVATFIVAYAAVGVLIVWHRPHEPVGEIAIWSAPAMGLGEALVSASYAVLRDHPDDRVAALGSALGSTLRGGAWLVLVLWLPLCFPHGLRPSTRLRRVASRFVVVTIAGFSLVSLLSPRLTELRVDDIDNPVGLPAFMGPPMETLAGINLLMGVTSLGLAVACLGQQYRRDDPLGRQQTLVFALAFLPPLAAFAASSSDAAGPWLFGVATLPLPLAIGVAILQRRLYDLPLVINRSVTYGSLWLAIALLYAVVVGGVGAMLQQQDAAWLPWLAAGVVAVSFAPLRDALQRGANRLTFGQWSQPSAVLGRTAQRLADAGDVRALLKSLASELASDLGLGHVEIRDRFGATMATAGEPSVEMDELPLTAYGEMVGALRWTRRHLRESDRELLAGVAAQLGSIVHAEGLLESVRAAQERLVLAREEERRRLRRDLHDGLGPSLAALTLQVDTLRNILPAGNAQSGLLDLRSRIQDTIVEVRRIVEGLQPATLDDLGLEESLRQLTRRFARAGSLEVEVEVEPLPALPAAVEVGAYRIVQESLTNVVRHADARAVRVGVHLRPHCLEVCVVDDGTGQIRPRAEGVGLGSMRARAEEIGGQFELIGTPGSGTTVRARLPLPNGVGR